MPVDLDLPPEEMARIFGALGAHADGIPLGTPEGARRRAQQRRQRLVATATALAVLLAAGTAGAIRLTRDPVPTPAEPSPRPTVDFVPLRPAGSIPTDGDPRNPRRSTILDGVAYVVSGASPTRVGALDLTTGASVFDTVSLGEWLTVDEIVARPHGLLVTGLMGDEHPGYTEGGEPLTSVLAVLDPRSGAVRWQRNVGPEFITAYDDAVVVYDPTTSRLAGLDWRTGDDLWSRSIDARRGIVPVYLGTPTLPAWAGEWGVDPGDVRLLVTSSTTVEIVDVRTGTTLTQIPFGEVDSITVIDGTLYTTTGGGVWAQPLDGSAGPTRIRTGTGGEAFRVSPCGAGLVCLFSDLAFSVIALDADTYQERFRQRHANSISVVGDRLLTSSGELWDLEGRQLAGNSIGVRSNDAAWWLTPGSVLRLHVDFPSATQWPTVEGVSTEDGAWLDLGEVPTLEVGAGCAADLHYLVCPTTDGFHAWQFATE